MQIAQPYFAEAKSLALMNLINKLTLFFDLDYCWTAQHLCASVSERQVEEF